MTYPWQLPADDLHDATNRLQAARDFAANMTHALADAVDMLRADVVIDQLRLSAQQARAISDAATVNYRTAVEARLDDPARLEQLRQTMWTSKVDAAAVERESRRIERRQRPT